jgi:hypothetical protein
VSVIYDAGRRAAAIWGVLSNLAICITEGIPVRHAGSAQPHEASEAAGKRMLSARTAWFDHA